MSIFGNLFKESYTDRKRKKEKAELEEKEFKKQLANYVKKYGMPEGDFALVYDENL